MIIHGKGEEEYCVYNNVQQNKVSQPIIRKGYVQAMNGNKLMVNTQTDEMVEITCKDKDIRWELYCSHVKITIEIINEEGLNNPD